MERVYLESNEFQELLDEQFKGVRYTQLSDRKQTDPELLGLRVIECSGVQYVEKPKFEG